MAEAWETIKNIALWIWGFDQIRFVIDALVKLSITTILSGFIGFEREHSHRPAGFRTHILVAVGSALVMLTSVYIYDEQSRSRSSQCWGICQDWGGYCPLGEGVSDFITQSPF